MVLVISQETFDEAVEENIVDFQLDPSEAIEETKQQFLSQGVSLANITFTRAKDDGTHGVLETSLFCLEEDSITGGVLVQHCKIIKDECKKSLANKIMCTKRNGYTILMNIIKRQLSGVMDKKAALEAMASLLDGNPDPIDMCGIVTILNCIDEAQSTSSCLLEPSLEVILSICVRHEQNRLNLVAAGVLPRLSAVFDTQSLLVALIWRSMVQDDDIRVEFGKAHEHARIIVENHDAIRRLINVLSETRLKHMAEGGGLFVGDYSEHFLAVIGCLSNLCVRNEFCEAAVSAGGLDIALDVLLMPISPLSNADESKDLMKFRFKIVSNVFRFLLAIAGNDDAKNKIVQANGVFAIVNALDKFSTCAAVARMGCLALAAITLRNPKNAKRLVTEASGANIIVQLMKIHKKEAEVQISVAKCIRNVVSRSNELRQHFIELEVEALLLEAKINHPSCEEYVNPALRDLGINVALKEEWTGVGTLTLNGKT